ncbi:MAG: 50S ribosomal protein L11 methyltransferase [Cyanobacteria bacterium P01_H01_bin.15]
MTSDPSTEQWWEIEVLCEPILEDAVFLRLSNTGCQGTATEYQQDRLLLKGYLPRADVEVLDLAAVTLWLKQDAQLLSAEEPQLRWHVIEGEDWASSWQQHWQPLSIGDRFLVCPAWLAPEKAESERLMIRLNPGAAFGTGVHPTTQLCLESLEMRFLLPPEIPPTIADIGCGSGILSIGAMLLGAKSVVAVDIDSLAVRSTLHNRKLNKIPAEKLRVKQGTYEELLSVTSNGFDGIVCNILAEVIVEIIPHLSDLSQPTTWGVLSGILSEQAPMVSNVLEKHGWIVATIWQRDPWCCINIRRE